MSVYEVIISIDSTTLESLIDRGIFRSTMRRDIAIYEFYIKQRKTVGYMDARTRTAEKFCLSEEMISKIIQRFK